MSFSFHTPSINTKTKVNSFSENFSNPVFAQQLSFRELELQTLWLTFLSFDASSRHEVIGQVVLPLAGLNISSENVFRTDIRPSLQVNERLWCSKKNLNKKTQRRRECLGLHSTRVSHGRSLFPCFPANCSHVPTVFPYLLPFELKQGRRQRQRRRQKTISLAAARAA